MTRHDTRNRRTHARRGPGDLWGQTAAASALAGGCLALVALWKTAAGNGGNRSAGR